MLNLNGTFNRRFSFGKDAENNQIIDAKFFTHEGVSLKLFSFHILF